MFSCVIIMGRASSQAGGDRRRRSSPPADSTLSDQQQPQDNGQDKAVKLEDIRAKALQQQQQQHKSTPPPDLTKSPITAPSKSATEPAPSTAPASKAKAAAPVAKAAAPVAKAAASVPKAAAPVDPPKAGRSQHTKIEFKPSAPKPPAPKREREAELVPVRGDRVGLGPDASPSKRLRREDGAASKVIVHMRAHVCMHACVYAYLRAFVCAEQALTCAPRSSQDLQSSAMKHG